MNLKYFFVAILTVLCHWIYGQDNFITNTFNRESTSLNGYWQYIVDPYENGFYNYRYEPFENQSNPGNGAFFNNAKRKGKLDLVEYDFDKMDSLWVPGDWNSQKQELLYYEGTVWYKKSFDYKKADASNRVFVYFGGANYKTDVYLNGKKLGQHIGGFTPFQFEITHLLKDKENFFVIKVDNKRVKEGVPTLNTDWWNYGGLTRDIKLVETSETFISDYRIGLSDKSRNSIQGEIVLKGDNTSNQVVVVKIPELGVYTTLISDNEGRCTFEAKNNKIQYWSTVNPKLYEIQISTKRDDVRDRVGFRTIGTEGSDILLNGKSIFLKGISIHEESPIRGGRANTKEDALKLLTWAKDLGCNYVRLAHYPHNEYMIRMADEMGMLVWEEIPVYWTIDWENKGTFLNAQNQISEIIDRDKNRACVVIWSMANETPRSEARNSFLQRLASFTRAKDPTRLISAALEQKNVEGQTNTRTIEDDFASYVDVLSFNQYIGWYDGGVEKCKKIKWDISQNKPVIISEFGAGAKHGLHGAKDNRWTEEYQEYLYDETLMMLDKIDQLRGISPWILVDFKSPRRVLAEIQDTYNRKGLISEKGERKKAFYTLKNYYESK